MRHRHGSISKFDGVFDDLVRLLADQVENLCRVFGPERQIHQASGGSSYARISTWYGPVIACRFGIIHPLDFCRMCRHRIPSAELDAMTSIGPSIGNTV